MKKIVSNVVFLAIVASRGIMHTELERMGSQSTHKHQLGIFPPEIDFRFPQRVPMIS
ncbi:MAG: hypothetical protein Q6373_019165 [Candidatus Sigynarchaeota archaeon]